MAHKYLRLIFFPLDILQLRTKKRILLACLIVWVASSLMSFPVAVYSGTEDVTGETRCKIMFPGYQRHNNSIEYVVRYMELQSVNACN